MNSISIFLLHNIIIYVHVNSTAFFCLTLSLSLFLSFISYLSSCQDVLTEVYTQLMLPLPSDLSSSPDRPLSPPDPSAVEGGEGEEGESSEEWTPLASLEEPPGAPKQTKLGLKRSELIKNILMLHNII